MRKPKPIKGHVTILWRLAASWRSGAAKDRLWHYYSSASPNDAEQFMRKKAVHVSEIWEFKIQNQNAN